MTNLEPFKREIRTAQKDMDAEWSSDHTDLGPSLPAIMVWKYAIDFATVQLQEHPEIALSFKNQHAAGGTAEDRWWGSILNTAWLACDPEMRNPELFRLRVKSYHQLADRIFANAEDLVKFGFRIEGEVYEFRQTVNPVLITVAANIAYSLRTYPARHKFDQGFLDHSAETALMLMLRDERPDLDLALRLVNELPRDEHVARLLPPVTEDSTSESEDVPLYQDVVEFVVSCIPVVGTGVMLYESILGQNLFGRDLSVPERALLAVGTFLPMAAHLVEDYNAIYSAERMSRLYNTEVETWNKSLAISEKLSAESGSFKILGEAQEAVAAGKSIPPRVASEVEKLLKAINIAKADQGTPTVLSKVATETFNKLVLASPRWAEIDANALQRILKNKRYSGIVGQLFEEVMFNRITMWLADPAGKAALGLADVTAHLEFIPGHLIRSPSGRQITDGMIVQRLGKGRYAIWAVFEAKSSQEAAFGLSRTRVSLSRMSKADRDEVRAEAEEAMEVLKERAQKTGIPVSMTIEDIEKEILEEAEHGGQIVRDIERLYGEATDTLISKPQKLWIGGEEVEVRISPKSRTKFFGVTPSDVDGTVIVQELRSQGVSNFVLFKFGYTQKELEDAAKLIQSRQRRKP